MQQIPTRKVLYLFLKWWRVQSCTGVFSVSLTWLAHPPTWFTIRIHIIQSAYSDQPSYTKYHRKNDQALMWTINNSETLPMCSIFLFFILKKSNSFPTELLRVPFICSSSLRHLTHPFYFLPIPSSIPIFRSLICFCLLSWSAPPTTPSHSLS